jgi:hypothetical protein
VSDWLADIDLSSYALNEKEAMGLTTGGNLDFSGLSYVVIEEPDRGVPTFFNNLYRLLTFWLPRPKVNKVLLNNVSGSIRVCHSLSAT